MGLLDDADDKEKLPWLEGDYLGRVLDAAADPRVCGESGSVCGEGVEQVF